MGYTQLFIPKIEMPAIHVVSGGLRVRVNDYQRGVIEGISAKRGLGDV